MKNTIPKTTKNTHSYTKTQKNIKTPKIHKYTQMTQKHLKTKTP